MNDLLNQLMAYEAGQLDEAHMIIFFQQLVDTGLAWQLQGHYGRIAQQLIRQGLLTLQPKGSTSGEVNG
jgi:hypothetical protein